jgi:hypothetical protein
MNSAPETRKGTHPSDHTHEPKSDRLFQREWADQIEAARVEMQRQRRIAEREVRRDAWSGKHINTRRCYPVRLIERDPTRGLGTKFRYVDTGRPTTTRIALAPGFELRSELD